jgi:glutamyl/glutaminyl-tRNA synthetase
MNKFNLTRYAPTPSGYLHFGNLYSFVLTYHLAKKHQAKILLRIDDLDRERVKKAYIQDIFDTMDFLEIPFQLGPKTYQEFKQEYSQHLRQDLYQAAILDLQKKDKLFACDCSRSKISSNNSHGIYPGSCRKRQIPFNTPNCALRIKTPFGEGVTILTLDDGQKTALIPGILTDVVVRKKDGFPAYQLASLVDDLHYAVDFIVRGKDLWGSSLVQLWIAQELGNSKFHKTIFHHHQLLLGVNKQKLSKSAGDTSIRFFRLAHKTKIDVFQHLANLLGHNSKVFGIEDFDFLVKT